MIAGSKPKAGTMTHSGGLPRLPDGYIIEAIERSERCMHPFIPVWEEALSFFDNNQYVERSAISGELVSLETREGSVNAKPRWRSRMTRNRYTPGIERVRSRFASRVPAPICSAPSHNAESRSAASLAEKACLSAYRKLRIKQVALDTMVYTFNCGAGYVWPHWDADVGKFIRDTRPSPEEELQQIVAGSAPPAPEPGLMPGDSLGPPPAPVAPAPAPAPERWLREGEIAFWVLHPRDVGYQPGVPFEDSRYYFVRRALPVKEVLAQDGYCGPSDLAADAVATTNRDSRSNALDASLVFVYHYLERPSKKYRQGRWLQMANGALIQKEREYPCTEDVPVLHELADIRRPHRDRPMGRGEMALDIQRTYHRTINQIIHWKNLTLNPQMLAPKGSIRTPRTGEPGLVIEYRPMGGVKPEWIPVPDIPMGLFRTLEQCMADFDEVFGDGDLQTTGETSGSAIAQVRLERDESRRATFSENLAMFYQQIFAHILYLMQRHYTEPRILEFKGRFGIESIVDFMGAKLMPGISVFVDPGSVVPRTREAQEAKLIAFAERGWIPPHQIIAAVRSGDSDSLIDEYELDEARAHREIQQLIAMGQGEGQGPVFAAPMDNHQVHLWVLGAWMKTEDFERMPLLVKEATMAHYQQHEAELAYQAMEQAMAVQAAAADRGMTGAAGGKTTPGSEGGASPSPAPGAGGPMVSQPSVESTVRGLQGRPSA